MATHGETRNQRTETTGYGSRTLLLTETGEVLYAGPICTTTYTVKERYCATCEAWVEVKGLAGIFAMLAEGCPTCHAAM